MPSNRTSKKPVTTSVVVEQPQAQAAPVEEETFTLTASQLKEMRNQVKNDTLAKVRERVALTHTAKLRFIPFQGGGFSKEVALERQLGTNRFTIPVNLISRGNEEAFLADADEAFRVFAQERQPKEVLFFQVVGDARSWREARGLTDKIRAIAKKHLTKQAQDQESFDLDDDWTEGDF